MKLLNRDEHAASETSPLPPSAFVKVKSAVILAFHFNKLIKIVQICFGGLKYDFVLVTRDDDHWLGTLNFSSYFEHYAYSSETLFTKQCFRGRVGLVKKVGLSILSYHSLLACGIIGIGTMIGTGTY